MGIKDFFRHKNVSSAWCSPAVDSVFARNFVVVASLVYLREGQWDHMTLDSLLWGWPCCGFAPLAYLLLLQKHEHQSKGFSEAQWGWLWPPYASKHLLRPSGLKMSLPVFQKTGSDLSRPPEGLDGILRPGEATVGLHRPQNLLQVWPEHYYICVWTGYGRCPGRHAFQLCHWVAHLSPWSQEMFLVRSVDMLVSLFIRAFVCHLFTS